LRCRVSWLKTAGGEDDAAEGQVGQDQGSKDIDPRGNEEGRNGPVAPHLHQVAAVGLQADAGKGANHQVRRPPSLPLTAFTVLGLSRKEKTSEATMNPWMNLGERYQISMRDGFSSTPEADLALANIHLDVLLDLLAIPEFLHKKWYIFSGILGTQIERFLAALQASPLSPLEVRDGNLWFTVLARGKP